MFDQLLQIVKDHLSNGTDLASSIPGEHSDAIHQEIADTIHNHMDNSTDGEFTSLLSGNSISSEVTQGLVQKLTEKFNLSPEIANTIAAQVPGMIGKVLNNKSEPGTGGTGNFLSDLFK